MVYLYNRSQCDYVYRKTSSHSFSFRWAFLLSDALLLRSGRCSFSCFVAGNDCVAEFIGVFFPVVMAIDVCEIVYMVLNIV